MRYGIASEGWVFIVPAALLAVAALAAGFWVVGIILAVLALFLLSFFRDPRLTPGQSHDEVLSPADGTVVRVGALESSPWEGLTQQISIFMSVFDVHVNRAPVTGEIIHYTYQPGAKGNAMSDKSSEDNEQNLIVMRDDQGRVLAFKQIAGLLARRIVFDLAEGDRAERGTRIGMIRFGSRVDVFLPPEAKIAVSMREKVRVGRTVLATFGQGRESE